MKNRCLFFLAVTLLACGSLFAQKPDAPEPKGILHSTIPVNYDLTEEGISNSIIKAALGRRWTVIDEQPGRIEVNLTQRGYDSTLTFVFDTSEIKIYSDSYAVKKNGERKKRKEPTGWIQNLEKDIPVFMGREAFL